MALLYKDKTEKIIKIFYKVYNTLGYGFLERVYHNAFLIELRKEGFKCDSNFPIRVFYESFPVGDYYADILVDGCIILELKALESLREEHEFQLINYLKATNQELGILFNFGKTPAFKRILFTNDRKTNHKKENTDYTDITDQHGFNR